MNSAPVSKINRFFTISDDGSSTNWCYSADALEREFTEALTGDVVQGVYFQLGSYMVSPDHSDLEIDFAPSSGYTVIVFKQHTIKLRFYAEGMLEYLILPSESITISERRRSIPLGCAYSPNAYISALDHGFREDVVGETLHSVCVVRTHYWPFSISEFDDARAEVAAAEYDLPDLVLLHLSHDKNIDVFSNNDYFRKKLDLKGYKVSLFRGNIFGSPKYDGMDARETAEIKHLIEPVNDVSFWDYFEPLTHMSHRDYLWDFYDEYLYFGGNTFICKDAGLPEPESGESFDDYFNRCDYELLVHDTAFNIYSVDGGVISSFCIEENSVRFNKERYNPGGEWERCVISTQFEEGIKYREEVAAKQK